VKGFGEISSNVRALVEKARKMELSDNDFNGGTITITNLGMYGVRQFAAIIPPPQACVLAVGTVEKRVIPTPPESEEEYEFAEMMTVTLSCDHRVVDGAVGAQWLAQFKGFVEDPVSMLL
jgi:pyruvate dehydrogenase E2 component (dihydrolipoamide acetyltransferase)